jgi:hypothetical protein
MKPVELLRGSQKMVAAPPDTKERARLEMLAAREASALDAADSPHLTGTFTYASGNTKAELDEIIARSPGLTCCQFRTHSAGL